MTKSLERQIEEDVKVLKVGSICSGIEAASVAWSGIGFDFSWFSEIAEFQSRFLSVKYPQIPNEGDLCKLPEKISARVIPSVDVICGGTPCQAFSLSGRKRGLEDERGQLTLKFIDTIDANDEMRDSSLPRTMVLWENVEGVLKDKTNAFGCFISALSGCGETLDRKTWPNAGLVRGPKRNVAWRVIDAKYFGLPQQRRRLYVLAGGKDFNPENILFEKHEKSFAEQIETSLIFEKNGKQIEVFRAYTDCLYSAYGTKWNGNAAAYNGSLFVAQDGRLRRFTPLECERLMGFPDNYTAIEGASNTNRYQGVGNSWAVPVVRWIGERLVAMKNSASIQFNDSLSLISRTSTFADGTTMYDFSKELLSLSDGTVLNATEKTEEIKSYDIHECIDTNAEENFYISSVGCAGILRRRNERNVNMNPRLEAILKDISQKMSVSEIEKISLRQKRGAYAERAIV